MILRGRWMPMDFKKRMDNFLSIAAKHKIKVLFAFLMIAGIPMLKPGNNQRLKPGVLIVVG
jgi:hypothetical protein